MPDPRPPRANLASSWIAATPSAGSRAAVGCVPALLLLVLLGLRAQDVPPLERGRLLLLDSYQQVQPRQAKTRAVAIVDVDEPSLATLGQWPWPRTQIADLVERLVAAGAVAIAFDVVFAEPDRLSPALFAETAGQLPPNLRAALQRQPSNDAVLATALARHPVVLGMATEVGSARRPDTRAAGAGLHGRRQWRSAALALRLPRPAAQHTGAGKGRSAGLDCSP